VSDPNSYRQILRSSSIIGGASVVNILIGLVRTKVAAVLLGPAGVGLIGLLQNLMATASTISALGFGTVGTRQIAEAAGRDDEVAVIAARRALFWGTMGLAIVGAGCFWLLRETLSEKVLQDPGANQQLAWLAVGVALTVAAGAQTALLNGLRRIGDLARLSISSSLLSTLLGIGALLWCKEAGLLLFVLAAPVSSFLLGHWFVRRLGRVQAPATPLAQITRQWRTMAKLGVAFMVSGVAVTIGQLAVRTLVQRDLGPEALGQFQAAWAISMTYITFVLSAMGTDYYPRLTAVIHDQEAARQLVNEQTEVALLLAGPVFLAMIGLAPWVIDLLYSSAFDQSVTLLRWQVAGDLLKVASWPLGFVLLAAGDGRTFMCAELVAIGTFVLFTWIGLPILGVQATGVGFFIMYAAYLPLAYWLSWRRVRCCWPRHVVALFLLFLTACGSVFAIAQWSERGGGVAGVVLAVAMGVYGLARLGRKANFNGRLGKIAGVLHQIIQKTGMYRD